MAKHENKQREKMEARMRRSGHGQPITRRDFLGQGLIAGLGMVALPTLSGLLGREAHAQVLDCGQDNGAQFGAGKIPFLCVDLGGGANVAGSNVMVGGAGGQLDFISTDGYARLGLPSAIAPQTVGVNTDLGLAFHPNSALLRGILDKTTPATRANVNGCVIPARSENDTGNNPHNPMHGISRAGADGELVGLIGSRNSDSGGRSDAPEGMIDLSVRPTKVSSASDAIGLVDTGRLLTLLNNQEATRAFQATEAISRLKLAKITEQQAVKTLVECGYVQATSTVTDYGDPTQLDPAADPLLQQIFIGNELTNGDLGKSAAVMKCVVNGWAGAGTWEFGGYDYHQDPRPETDGKDFVAGQSIGAALEYAALSNKPLMIYLLTDGSVSANTNQAEDDGNGTEKFRWRSDNSQTAATFFLVYSPNGRPELRNGAGSQQIGRFSMDGSVETAASPFANNVNQLAEMVVLNYLALHGEEGNFGSTLPLAALGSGAGLDPYIAFNSIV